MFSKCAVEGRFGIESRIECHGKNREMVVIRIRQSLPDLIDTILVDKIEEVLPQSLIYDLREMIWRNVQIGSKLGQGQLAVSVRFLLLHVRQELFEVVLCFIWG